MRVCAKHMAPAVETLFSKRDGTEYDLCAECKAALETILNGEEEVDNGRKRTGRPAKNSKK